MKQLSLISALIIVSLLILPQAKAQTSSWQECPSGEVIVRCETYDCPQGDTNKDGSCTLDDKGARFADARSNSLCSNPISGCGEVRYFPSESTSACAIRVKETTENCDLYNAGQPNFSTPTPKAATPTPKPTILSADSQTPTPKPSPTASPTSSKGGETAESLPDTGPSFLQTIFLVSLGFAGLYIYDKFRVAA